MQLNCLYEMRRDAGDRIPFSYLGLSSLYCFTWSNMTRLYDALDARFDDIDEVTNVAKYGCVAGVSSFIYSTELCEFYDDHESDIEQELDMHDVKFHDLVDTDEFYTMQDIKEKAVWFVVENYCQGRALSVV